MSYDDDEYYDLDGTLGKRVEAQMELDPYLDALAAWPFPSQTSYFMSGTNHPGEIAAVMGSGRNVGVAAPNLSLNAIEEIIRQYQQYGRVKIFVDSGAFSEFKFDAARNRPTWPQPITDAEWRKRLAKYAVIAEVAGPKAYLVAPDKIADQSGTLARLNKYADAVAKLSRFGANILVPVQRGRIPMPEFYAEERQILLDAGAVPNRMMPAVPMKKDATSLDELVEFVRSPEVCRDTGDRPRIHLLGRGVYSPAYRETIAAVVNACPDIEVFADSVRLRSSAVLGTRAGPKAKPGPYMLAQDLYRDLGMSPYDVKRLGLELAMEQADIMERIEAHRAGWWDPEGFDSPAATFRAFTAGYGYGGAVPYADLQPYRAIDDDVDE